VIKKSLGVFILREEEADRRSPDLDPEEGLERPHIFDLDGDGGLKKWRRRSHQDDVIHIE
jgi:hypothetical protein